VKGYCLNLCSYILRERIWPDHSMSGTTLLLLISNTFLLIMERLSMCNVLVNLLSSWRKWGHHLYLWHHKALSWNVKTPLNKISAWVVALCEIVGTRVFNGFVNHGVSSHLGCLNIAPIHDKATAGSDSLSTQYHKVIKSFAILSSCWGLALRASYRTMAHLCAVPQPKVQLPPFSVPFSLTWY